MNFEGPKPRSVSAFEELLAKSVKEFFDASNTLGEPLSLLANKVVDAFQKNLALIKYGLINNEPAQTSDILEDYFEVVREIVDTKETFQDDPFNNHFATVASAILALGWITVKTAPAQFIRDMREAGEYFSNRVLSRNKGDQLHVNWVNKWNQLLVDLQQYVATYFLAGFTWASEAKRSGIPPPPPPPAGDGLSFGISNIGASGDGLLGSTEARQALLHSLNQGSDITRNLKKVNRDQTVLKQSGPVPVAHAPRQGKLAVKAPIRPPKFIFEGKKWIVENQKNDLGLTVKNDDMSQSLSMYNCEDTGLKVENKMNSVVIDSCKRTCVMLKSIISSVELIRCDRVKIQLDETVPLVSLDSCDSVQIFLTSKSRDVEVISSKSNSCNICLVKPDGDYKEHAMPEQIKTVLVGDRLVSSVLEKN